MANDLQIKLDLDIQSFLNSLKDVQTKANNVINGLDNKQAKVSVDLDTKNALNEAETLKNKIENDKIVITPDVDTSKAESKASGLSGLFGGALLGGAVAGLAANLVGNIAEGVGKLAELSLEADEIGDNMQLAFSQAGLSGKALAEEIDRADKFGFKLGQTLAVSPTEIKKLSISVASLSGATGKANEDLTKLAIGIEKASGGAVSGEQAIKVFSRGVADPENAEAIDKLTKKFPALGDAIRSSGDVAGKTNAALLALAPTFKTLEEQAGGADAVFERLSNAGLEGALKFAGGIIDGLGEAGNVIANAGAGFDFQKIFDVLSIAGKEVGSFIGDIVSGIVNLFGKVKPVLDVLGAIVGGVIVVSFIQLKEAVVAAFEILAEIGGSIAEVFSPVTEIFQSASKSAFDLGGFLNELSAYFRNVFGIVTELVSLALVPLTFVFKTLVSNVVDVISFFSGLFTSTKQVNDVTKQGNSIFDGFNGTLLKVRATISGVVESAKAISDTFFKAFQAIKSFDLKGAIDSFTSLGAKTKQAYDKGYNEVVDKETAKRLQDKAESDKKENADSLTKFNDTTDKKTKKAKEHNKTLLQLAQERFQAESLTSDNATTNLSNEKEALALSENRKLNESEIKEVQKSKSDEAKRLVAEYEKIFKITKDSNGNVTTNLKGLNDKDAQNVIKGYNDTVKKSIEAQKAQINLAPPKPENIADLIKEIETLSKNKDIILNSNIDFSEAVAKGIEALNNKENELKLQLTGETNKDTINSINKQIAEIEKSKAEITKNAEKTSFEASIQIRKNNLLLITDIEKKQLEEKLIALDVAQQKELETIGLTNEQKLAIEKDFAEKRKTLFGENQSEVGKIFKDFTDNLDFGNINFVNDKSVKEAKDKLKEVNEAFEKNKQSLDKQLKSGEISYNEYVSKVGELEATRAENSKEANEQIAKDSNKLQRTLDVFNKAGERAFGKLQENKQKVVEKYSKVFLEENSKQVQDETKKGEALTQVYEAVGIAQSAQLGAMILNGENAGQAFLKVAFDTLDGLVPILTAQIFGQSLASLGPIAGAVISGLSIATFKGLIAVARSAVGAEEGGLITESYSKPKGRTDTIPMWLAPNEFVINAESSKKYRSVLESINNGTYSYNALANPYKELNLSHNIVAGGVNMDLSGVEKRLQRIESAVLETHIKRSYVEVQTMPMTIKGNDLHAIQKKAIVKSYRLR